MAKSVRGFCKCGQRTGIWKLRIINTNHLIGKHLCNPGAPIAALRVLLEHHKTLESIYGSAAGNSSLAVPVD